MDHGIRARRRITLQDLAGTLGVSKTTVSNAFSRPDQLSPELRERVMEAAREAGYAGPNPVARMLRTGRAGAIGLILPESLPFALDDPTTSELIRGIADACEERRLGLLIVPGATRARDPRTITDVAVNGFIAYSLPWETPALQHVLARGEPVVVVDEPRIPGVATVGVDDFAGAQLAAGHLVRLGHRRLGIVTSPFKPDGYTGRGDATRIASSTFDVATRRLQGYRAALADAGLAVEDVPLYECALSDEELGRQAGHDLLERSPRPTAILAMSDRLALRRAHGGPGAGGGRAGGAVRRGLRRRPRGRHEPAIPHHCPAAASPQGVRGRAVPARRPRHAAAGGRLGATPCRRRRDLPPGRAGDPPVHRRASPRLSGPFGG